MRTGRHATALRAGNHIAPARPAHILLPNTLLLEDFVNRLRIAAAATLTAALVLALGPVTPAAAAVTGYTWAGYVLVGHSEGFRQVGAEITVPTVTCTSPNSKASFWIGLDGYNHGTAQSGTVEQVGISTDCGTVLNRPFYGAWWEMYPNGVNYMFAVSPGDKISMLVKYAGGGTWDLALTDLTHNDNAHKFNLPETCPSGQLCQNMSAEAVLEADGGHNLSQFTPTTFSDFQAVDSSGATVGLFADGSYWGLAETLMTGSNGQNLANVGPITNNDENYTLTYHESN